MTRAAALACLAAGGVLSSAAGCATREIPPRGATYDDVRPVLSAACAECHGDARAEADYRVEPYLGAIACPSGAEFSAVEPPDESAALLAVLARDDHRDLLGPSATLLVSAWVADGSPARIGAAHAAGIIDPRSPDFHGSVLREERWARLLDRRRPGACTQCHAGAALGPEDPDRIAAPGATACTSCHDEPDGPLACSTCHGDEGRAFPPRDPCWHADEAGRGGAHARHDARGIECATCHGERDLTSLAAGPHGDGVLDVVLDPARAGAGARFEPATRTCATSCHDRGGARPEPRWEAGAGLDCGSCHQSPPTDHYAGTCDACHAEASPDGTALLTGPLHLNGILDLGDGSGGCGACHGEGDDPTPDQGAHAAHAEPSLRLPIDCAECHAVPAEPLAASHFDATLGAEVVLGPLASARGRAPEYLAPTCRDVACHGAGLGGGSLVEPRWDAATGDASACGSCHGVPPPAPHTAQSSCSSLTCHGGFSTREPGVSDLGRTVHVDGRVDLW